MKKYFKYFLILAILAVMYFPFRPAGESAITSIAVSNAYAMEGNGNSPIIICNNNCMDLPGAMCTITNPVYGYPIICRDMYYRPNTDKPLDPDTH